MGLGGWGQSTGHGLINMKKYPLKGSDDKVEINYITIGPLRELPLPLTAHTLRQKPCLESSNSLPCPYRDKSRSKRNLFFS